LNGNKKPDFSELNVRFHVNWRAPVSEARFPAEVGGAVGISEVGDSTVKLRDLKIARNDFTGRFIPVTDRQPRASCKTRYSCVNYLAFNVDEREIAEMRSCRHSRKYGILLSTAGRLPP
jgi:hypothetical protein